MEMSLQGIERNERLSTASLILIMGYASIVKKSVRQKVPKCVILCTLRGVSLVAFPSNCFLFPRVAPRMRGITRLEGKVAVRNLIGLTWPYENAFIA